MTGFTLSPYLPYELRILIWGMTIKPRTVEARIIRKYGDWGSPIGLSSSTPIPSIFQTCHEAHDVGLRYYKKAFWQLTIPEIHPRYVWVNFELDLIDIGDTYFDHVKAEDRVRIRRLRFEREYSDTFYFLETFELRDLYSPREIHVLCTDGNWCWAEPYDHLYRPCGPENLTFINKETGEVWGPKEIKMQFQYLLAG
ncbi:2EXR domain-containing protein [Aspergillus stella-maris]|uniref:2EXR domain-containing protein n=1 Tax=Aspergillus stella-maris TaxID=1810926 RepID=UPI003CCE1C89